MVHLVKPSMRPLLSLWKGQEVIISELKVPFPWAVNRLLAITETLNQAFINKEALFVMWGHLFLLNSDSLGLGSELQNLQRAPNHPSEFILTRFFILIFSFHNSSKMLMSSNSVFSLRKVKMHVLPFFSLIFSPY